MEASPKTGFNTQEIFIQAALLLYNDYIKYEKKKIGIKIKNKVYLKDKSKNCL